MNTTRSGGIVVFGGGTATNSLVDVFEDLRRSRNCELSYVIPISDNGGSSSELIRVFGGPGIGDVRSRLVRLIPDSDTDQERASIRELFNYRLTSSPEPARTEWLSIVEGQHPLWLSIGSEKRELIRSIFNLVHMEIVKRARPPHSTFNFTRASIGNLFLTGARVFTGSLESAIYLLSTICGVPGHVTTLPAINSNFTHHISASLEDGSVITGQNNISHPSAPTAIPDGDRTATDGAGNAGDSKIPSLFVEDEDDEEDGVEDANPPGALPTLRNSYINFQKTPGVVSPSPAKSTATETSSSSITSTPSPLSPANVESETTVSVPPINGSVTSTICSSSSSTTSTISTTQKALTTSVTAEVRLQLSPQQEVEHGRLQQQPHDASSDSASAQISEKEEEPRPTRTPTPTPTQAQTQTQDEGHDHLPYPISRIWYINPYGHEIRPRANTKVIRAVEASSAVIYSIGSLYTSLVPSLVLRGVGRALAGMAPPPSSRSASPSARGTREEKGLQAKVIGPHHKILILNSSLDRETGGLDATGFVVAIAKAGAESLGDWEGVELLSASSGSMSPFCPSTATNLSPAGALSPSSTTSSLGFGAIPMARGGLWSASTTTSEEGSVEQHQQEAKRRNLIRRFVTHLLYLEDSSNSTTPSSAPQPPKVDRAALNKLGVHAIRVYGRREEGKDGKGMLRYDENGLARTLEAVIGSGSAGGTGRERERDSAAAAAARRGNMMGVSGVVAGQGNSSSGQGTGGARGDRPGGGIGRGRRSTVSGQ